MKRSRFTPEQVIGILKEHEGAVSRRASCRESTGSTRPLALGESRAVGAGEVATDVTSLAMLR